MNIDYAKFVCNAFSKRRIAAAIFLLSICLQFGCVSSQRRSDLSGRCEISSGWIYSWGVANCTDKGFTEIPRFNQSERFNRLDLERNKITILEASDFTNLSFLEFLDLRGNLINISQSGVFQGLSGLKALVLTSNNITTLKAASFKGLTNLTHLHLDGNQLTSLAVGLFEGLSSLEFLNLDRNQLTSLPAGAFEGLPCLRWLYLYGNQLTSLSAGAFDGVSLTLLQLGGNKLTELNAGVFRDMSSLKWLLLDNNSITTLESGVFQGPKIPLHIDLRFNKIEKIEPLALRNLPSNTTINSDDWKVCCIARTSSNIACQDGDPFRGYSIIFSTFSSCEDLMHDTSLRIFVWILGSFSVAFNLGVITWRLVSRYRNRKRRFSEPKLKQHLLSVCLAFGDLCMGIFLFIIGRTDDTYRGYYILQDDQWRKSSLCSFAGFLSAFSSEFPVFILTLITFDRYTVILYGSRGGAMSYSLVKTIAICLFVIAALLAAIPLMTSTFSNFYSQTGTCLALPLTIENSTASNTSTFGETRPNWVYSFSVFIVLNSVSVVTIIFCYAIIFRRAMQSNRRTNNTVRNLATRMGGRIMLIVATDMACWLPIIVLGFGSALGYELPSTVYAWVAVLVLPINSAVNPLIYSFQTQAFRKAVGKKFGRLLPLQRRYPNTESRNRDGSRAGQSKMIQMESLS